MAETCLIPTLTTAQIDAAAQQLQQRRQQGQVAGLLPPEHRPRQIADALAVQWRVAQQYGTVIGWKCGLPSVDAEGQNKIVVGPLYQQELQQGEQCALWPSAQGMARVEPEYAYPLLVDIPPGADMLSDAEVFALLGKPHLALELIQSRFQSDAGALFPDQLADGLFNQGLWLGPELTGAALSSFDLVLTPAGQPPQQYKARHPNDNPRAPIPWLVNFLRAEGMPLTAGLLLITGSFAGVLDLPFACDMLWHFGEEAPIRLRFCQKKPVHAELLAQIES